MSVEYRAVRRSKHGLVRVSTRWIVNVDGMSRWGRIWVALGLDVGDIDERVGPRLPHIIAGRQFWLAQDRLSLLHSTATWLAVEGCSFGHSSTDYILRSELPEVVLPLFSTTHAVAVVSEYVDLRGVSVADLEAGRARCL